MRDFTKRAVTVISTTESLVLLIGLQRQKGGTGPCMGNRLVQIKKILSSYANTPDILCSSAFFLPLAGEGDDLLADLKLFYCDTATFGESAANVQQVCWVARVVESEVVIRTPLLMALR